MTLIETGHHEVNADRYPDLGAHGVLAGAVKSFDAEVLLDPFEEQLDFPTAFVDDRDSDGWQVEVVGQEDQPFSSIRIDEADTSERLRIIPFSFCSAQTNGLVASESGRLVHRTGFEHVEPSVLFAADDEICVGLFDAEQAFKIEVSPIEHIDASRFEKDLVEEVHVMHGSLGNAHEYGDGTGQIDLGVQFDGSLGCSESGPRKQRKTKINGGGIHGVDHLLEIQSIGVVSIQSTGLADKHLSKCFIDPPVSMLVSVGEIGTGDITTNPHRIKVGTTSKTGLDIAQTFTKGDLREDHGKELITSRHGFTNTGHRVQSYAAVELLAVDKIGDLGENQASSIHSLLRIRTGNIRQPVQMRHICFLLLTH